MGNKPSSPPPPPPPPVVQEADYPGSKPPQESIIPGKPVSPRTDGVSISKSQACKECVLSFVPGNSTSSVSLTREFGGVRTCSQFERDLANVRSKKLAVRDFVGGIQSGQYMRGLSDGYCEEVRFPDDVVQKINTIDDLNNNLSSLTSVRIRQISSEGFSSDTKAIIKPSIPFKMAFNGNEFSVDTLSMYHPCPLRVQDQQADAVISLNDASAGNSRYILLVPITTGNPSTPSAEFFSKIANQLSNIELPNPATGQYTTTNIQTGKNWSLSQLFPIADVTAGKSAVNAGYFVWEGMPPFERYLEVDTPSVKRYGWRRKPGSAPVTYIMLEKPLPVSPNDLASLIRSVPVTDWTEAIHEVLEPTVYKQGPAGGCNVPMRETMANIKDTETCDPFLNNAMFAKSNAYSTDKIIGIVFNILLLLAAAIGAYIALAAVVRMYDVEYADFSKGAGRVMAVWAKSFSMENMAKNAVSKYLPPGLEASPLAALGNVVPGAVGKPMSALTNGVTESASAITNSVTKPMSALTNGVTESASAITNSVAQPVSALTDAVSSPKGKKWSTVQTPYLHRGTQKLGGDTPKRDRGRGGSTRKVRH